MKSRDFDDVYAVSGQSQLLDQLRNSNVVAPKKEDQESPYKKPQLNFGNEGVGSGEELIENSSNSMVNMAISMDPLQANRVLGALDQKAL